MTLTLKELAKNGILNELAALFQNEDMANILLDLIDFPVALRPDNDITLGYWREICNQIKSGAMQGGTDLQPLVDAAAELYPGNSVFQQYRSNPDVIKNEILNELAALFHDETRANLLLDLIEFPAHMRPEFPSNGRILGYWAEICNQVQAGVWPEGMDLQPLVDAAAELYPGNSVFQRYRSERTNNNNLFNILIRGREDADNILASAQIFAPAQNISPENITLRFSVNGVVLLGLNNCDSNTAASFSQGLQTILQSGQNQVQVSFLAEDPQPYLISRIFVEGPDQVRFAIEDIPSDTTVGEVAKGIMAQEYDPKMFQDSRGRARQVVVDRVNKDTLKERLNKNQALHETNRLVRKINL